MQQKVFVTGVTGKSGQYFLKECMTAPNHGYQFTFLVRNETKGERIKEQMSEAEVVYGSLLDKSLINSVLIGGGMI